MKLYGQTLKEWYQDIVADDPETQELFLLTLMYSVGSPLIYRLSRRTIRKRGGSELFAFAWGVYTTRYLAQTYHLQRLSIDVKRLRRELREQLLRPGTKGMTLEMKTLVDTAVRSLGCTGHFDDRGHLLHDGDTCPIHEP